MLRNVPSIGRLRAFTLSELLIAVAVLGFIATFAIPKVLTAVEEHRKVTVFKESYGIVSQAIDKLFIEGIDGNIGHVAMYAKLQEYIAAVKYCPNNALTEGCRTTTLSGWEVRPAMVLQNGAVVHISIYDPTVSWPSNIEFELDYNGDAGPNTAGAGGFSTLDTVVLLANYGAAPMTHPTQLTPQGNPYVIRPNTIVPWNPNTDGAFGFYELFTR
jgi:prepilin-type N-terminal cleavage/methylation domain-containing protein